MFRNVLYGVVGKLLLLAVTFISRSVFIYKLGLDYLGISSLFGNILQLLSLADLGISSAIIYSLYKPVADNDYQKLTALMSYFKKLYRIIAISVFVLGMCLMPFLRLIINVETEIPLIELYYFIILIDTSASYLFAYKTNIISANQMEYKLNIYDVIFSICRCISSVVVLLLFSNYTLYLILQVAFTVLSNMVKARKSEQLFPYIREKALLGATDRKALFSNARSLFVINIAGTVLNHTDNIIISSMLGTALVGIYSNYLLVTSNINQFISILTTALSASVGNLNASEGTEKQKTTFFAIDFGYWWFYAFSAITYWIVAPDFFTLWGRIVNNDVTLDLAAVLAVVVNFYMLGTRSPIIMARNTTGIFKDTQVMSIMAVILNIVFSLALGRLMGLSGVLFATALARLATTWWQTPLVLFKKHFQSSVLIYWKNHILRLLITLTCGGLLHFFTSFIQLDPIVNIIIKAVICLIIPNSLFYLIFKNTPEFLRIKNIVAGKISRLLEKIKHKQNLS